MLWTLDEDISVVKTALGEAQALMEKTGAVIYKPLIDDLQAKLATDVINSPETSQASHRSRAHPG